MMFEKINHALRFAWHHEEEMTEGKHPSLRSYHDLWPRTVCM